MPLHDAGGRRKGCEIQPIPSAPFTLSMKLKSRKNKGDFKQEQQDKIVARIGFSFGFGRTLLLDHAMFATSGMELRSHWSDPSRARENEMKKKALCVARLQSEVEKDRGWQEFDR